MLLRSALGAALLLAAAHSSLADEKVLSGPFYMCPDAHGAEQKARFKIIDITRMPMRIEGLGPRRVDGFAVGMMASASPTIAGKQDPLDEAFGRLADMAANRGESRRLVAVCFAQTPPPHDGTDGPFTFMPGYFGEIGSDVVKPLDTVAIPDQTYLVLTYKGPPAEVKDMRFTLSEQFWPQVAPFLGLERAVGPNLMIWAPGQKGNEPEVSLEMWTPIKPYRVSPR